VFRFVVRSRVARNAAAGFAAMLWLSGLSLFTIPIYVRLLGKDEWGLVAACASLQLVFTFIDSGFGQIVPRWVARDAEHTTVLRRYVVVFGRIYLALCVFGFLSVQGSAAYLASSWFQVPRERVADLDVAIRIIALQFAFQFLNSLCIAVWNGLQQQGRAGFRTCAFATLKHALTLSMLTLLAPKAWVYALVFAAVSACELTVNGLTLWRQFARKSLDAYSPPLFPLSSFLSEVSLLSLGIVVGLATSQLDRIVLSRTFSAADFGVYVVVANLALAFLQLPAPLTKAFFPRLVREITATGSVARRTFQLFIGASIAIGAAPALVASIFAQPLISLWIRDAHFADVGRLPLQLLLWAVAINVLYGCLYQLILAHGRSQLILKFNLAAFVAGSVTALIVGTNAGIALGGGIWIATTSTQLVLGVTWLALQKRQRPTINEA
jgi:O-antigen/teichoic acid export membrane protein